MVLRQDCKGKQGALQSECEQKSERDEHNTEQSDLPGDYMLGKPLCNCGFADPRFADKDWVVFRPPSQHLQAPLYRLIASNDRIETTCSSLFRQFSSKLLEELVGVLLKSKVNCTPRICCEASAISTFCAQSIAGQHLRCNTQSRYGSNPQHVLCPHANSSGMPEKGEILWSQHSGYLTLSLNDLRKSGWRFILADSEIPPFF